MDGCSMRGGVLRIWRPRRTPLLLPELPRSLAAQPASRNYPGTRGRRANRFLLFGNRILLSFERRRTLACTLPAQINGRDAQQTFDMVGEVAGVRETYRQGDLCYGKIVVREQALRPLDTLLDDVLVGGES